MPERLLKTEEMAKRLGVSAQTFRKDVRAKGIPHIIVGKRPRFDPDRVQAYLVAKSEVNSNVVQLKLERPRRRKSQSLECRFSKALNGDLS